LVRWAVSWLGHLGERVWVVADGAYAKAPFLKPMRALGVTVVSRLRKDSALWTVPGPRAPHRRGPNRIYGEQRIDLAKLSPFVVRPRSGNVRVQSYRTPVAQSRDLRPLEIADRQYWLR
jgi:hypothetical protein